MLAHVRRLLYAAPEAELLILAICGLLSAVLAPSGATAQGLALDTVEVASGLVHPLIIADAVDGSGRLFIGQQTGQILIRDGTGVLATPFLDLSGLVVCCNERGLLGLAFHPDYATNGELFVSVAAGGKLRAEIFWGLGSTIPPRSIRRPG